MQLNYTIFVVKVGSNMTKKVTLKSINVKSLHIKGLYKDFLRKQRLGLTGHIEVAGFPFNEISWAKFDVDTTKVNDNPGWWAYEQTAYALDGLERLGELLNNQTLLKKASLSYEYILNNQDEDGYLGPKFLKETDGWNRWPHVVFFRAMLARFYYNKDERIIQAITRHYLDNKVDYSGFRDVLNVEIMLLVYLINHNEKLLELALLNYQKYNEKCQDDLCEKQILSNRKPYAHGVSYNEFCKLGALFYLATKDPKYLKTSIQAYKKIDKYFMLVDGLHCSNEFLVNNNYMSSHETCDVSDYTWSLYYLLKATKDGQYADKIEKCILNAGIGSVLEDFKGLQYFSCPNQVILDNHSNHNLFFKGSKWMSYRPNPGTECCAGNVNRFMPNYCLNMYMKTDNDLYVIFYGANEYEDVIKNQKVKIIQKTNFPFDDNISLKIKTNKPIKFNLYVRIPAWSFDYQVFYNQELLNNKVNKGFMKINKVFQDNDEIKISLPSKIVISNYQNVGQYVSKGPLLYCLGMKGKRLVDESETKQNKTFKAYNIYPNESFNYALIENSKVKFITKEIKENTNLWDLKNVPYQIEIQAKKVLNWQLKAKRTVNFVDNLYKKPYNYINKRGKFVFTPKIPKKLRLSKEDYTITLVPYGCAKVRITIFPIAKVCE